MTGEEVLALPMMDNDADAVTVRDYLIKLLLELWREGEGFSGKRPFGNSGWESELYDALGAGGAVYSEVNEWGEYEIQDYDEADRLIVEAISALGSGS